MPHAVCIIPPDSPVKGKAEKPFSLYYCHFNCSLSLTRSVPLFMNAPAEVENQLEATLPQEDQHRFRCTMLTLVSRAVAEIPPELIRDPVTDTRIDKAYWLMKENIDRRISNRTIASDLNMSEASLLRMFRAAIGSSPQKEHLRLRLEHAAEMLRDSVETIETIAEACGFWDRNHFTRVFTREWNVPPAQYRRSSTAL